MKKKPAPPPVPPPAPEEKKSYAPGWAGIDEIMWEAALQYWAPLTADEIRMLPDAEKRQLWLQRREEKRRAEVLKAAEAVDKGGAPEKLPSRAEAEIRRRIGRGERKIAPTVAAKYPGVTSKRSWQRHVRNLRLEMKKATKPAG